MTELKEAMQIKQERAENEIVREESLGLPGFTERNLWNELMNALLDN